MTDQPKDAPKDPQKDAPQAGKAQPPATSAAPPKETAGNEPGTFGDGSTQAEQDRLVKEAEEANAAVKEAANAEREARSQ
jgi:outer membrane protein TolC